MIETEQSPLVELEVPVLTLPWVVPFDNDLALTTVSVQTLPNVISPNVPDVPDMELNYPMTIDLVERHTGDFFTGGLEVQPLCETHAGQVVGRVMMENLDIVAIVGYIPGSPADPSSSSLSNFLQSFRPREEGVVRQKINWDESYGEGGVTSFDSGRAAEELSALTLRKYEDDSNLKRVLDSLKDASEFVPVERPPVRVRVLAEKGIVPELYREMEYAHPRVVGYSVLETDGNIWRVDVDSESAFAPLPIDPQFIFPVNPEPVSQEWARFVSNYEQMLSEGLDHLTRRPCHPLTGKPCLKGRGFRPLTRLAKMLRELDPDRPDSGASSLLRDGLPTNIARGIIASAREAYLRAAGEVLKREYFHSHEGWLQGIFMALTHAGFEG